ncbi:uncharacterized protein LOC133300390 [Gastrolobium bilobum]|uniref:uncharacterized protein LOC133300390 n=1 Tax=Gastrolobium bilobum TaxID=150636 RepID=UPI002AAF5D88|nr:uncharacterized protein LOC133300390 [Gastrolobium bilobum]
MDWVKPLTILGLELLKSPEVQGCLKEELHHLLFELNALEFKVPQLNVDARILKEEIKRCSKTSIVQKLVKEMLEAKVLFDVVVITVNVTRNPDMRKIQGQIADMLGMTLLDDESDIMIIGQIWIPFEYDGPNFIKDGKYDSNFESWRITGNRVTGCKVMLISKTQQALLSLEVLTDEEAEMLFKKIATIGDTDPEFERLVAQIASKCKGLPMSVVKTAMALKNQTRSVWEGVNQKLEWQKFIGGGCEFSTKLSYELLENKELKYTFLLCAYMGHDALIKDLVKYCIGLGFLEGICTVREARDKVSELVEKLKESNLLSDSFSNDHFTMNDIVRSAALSIASEEEKHVFTMTMGKVDKWPNEDKLERYVAISLQHCDIIEGFPSIIKCPRLRVFHVNNSDPHLKIPENLFEGMKELTVLILTGFHLSPLPSSITCLTQLRMLCLEQCILGEDLSIIGKLERLRILSLSGSDIKKLPVELMKLTKLQIFDISNCSKLQYFPSNVINNLISLEELYTRNTLIQWNIEGQTNQSKNASLSELRHLNQLTALDIQIPNVAHLSNNLFLDKLNSYKIVIGDLNEYLETDFKMPEKYERSRFLAIQLKEGFDIHSQMGIQMLCVGVENLLLEDISGVQDIIYRLNLKVSPFLKHLSIVSNFDIQSLTNPKDRQHYEMAFRELESLFLYNLKKMGEVCSCKLSESSFGKLKVIKINLCNKLKNVFLLSVARLLTVLETIEVSECDSLKEIVLVVEELRLEHFVFPELRSLTLQSLPKCIGFSSIEGKTKELFNKEGNIFPSLKNFKLSGMRSLTEIWNDELPKDSFGKLDTLILEQCDKLEEVFPFNVKRNIFRSLCNLRVTNCRLMKEIFNGGARDVTNLQDVHLETLPKLKHIWGWKEGQRLIDISEELRKIFVRECHSLDYIFPVSKAKRLDNLEYLAVWKCFELREIVAEVNKEYAQLKFPKLTTIDLWKLPNLKSFYPEDHDLSCPVLNELCVRLCDKLEPFRKETTDAQSKGVLFPKEEEEVRVINQLKFIEIESQHAKSSSSYMEKGNYQKKNLEELFLCKLMNTEVLYSFLHCNPNLKDLVLSDCYFKEIVPIKRPPEIQNNFGVVLKLETLNLTDLPRLVEIGFERDIVLQRIESLILESCPSLVTMGPSSVSLTHLTILEVVDCNGLKYLMEPSTAKSLIQLTTLKVMKCKSLKEIVLEQGNEEENAGQVDIVFRQLKALELVSLKSLESFSSSNSCIFEFPALEKVVVSACPKMENFSEEANCTPSLQKIYVVHEQEKKWYWHCNLKDTIQSMVKEMRFLEGMDEINLSEHLELQQAWHDGVGLQNNWFYSLKTLKLINCEIQSYAIPSHLPYVKSLRELEVRKCHKVKAIFDMNNSENMPTATQLKILNLQELSELTHVWQNYGQGILRFPNLQQVFVSQCGNLKTLFSKKLETQSCRDLQEIVEDEEEVSENKFVFPQLTSLDLLDLPELTHFYPETYTLECPALNNLSLTGCRKLELFQSSQNLHAISNLEKQKLDWEHTLVLRLGNVLISDGYGNEKSIFPFEVLKKAPNLETMIISNCSGPKIFRTQNPEIGEDWMLEHLKILSLDTIDEIKSIELDDSSWLNKLCEQLHQLNVFKCPGLITLVDSAVSFSSIKKLNVVGCSALKYLFPYSAAKEFRYLEEITVKECESLIEIVGKVSEGDEEEEEDHEPQQFEQEQPTPDQPSHQQQQQQQEQEAPEQQEEEAPEENQAGASEENHPEIQQEGGEKQRLEEEEKKKKEEEEKEQARLDAERIRKGKLPKDPNEKEQQERPTHPPSQEEIKFEWLERIVLHDLPSLECFYSGNSTLQLPSLLQINIWQCPKMKIFSPEELTHSEYFRGIQVSSDSSDELVFHDDLNGSVKRVFLQQGGGLPELI